MRKSRKSTEIRTKSDGSVQLGHMTFDPSTCELVDADGRPVELRRQSGDVLAVLARHPGEMISKDDLIRRIWGDVAVTDDSLVQCIGDIRRALGPKGRDCVQTIPRRGYRMVPSPAGHGVHETARARFHVLLLLLTAALFAAAIGVYLIPGSSDPDGPVPYRPTVAVLPFDNMSGDQDQLYFSDGLTEDVTTDLSQVSGLRMISRASSFTYRNSSLSPAAIARELGASHLVTGSVRRDGRRIRINATLTDVATGENLWAHRYDRDIGGIFDLQDDVARAITSALAIQLTTSDEARFQRQQATDPDAYDLLLRGLETLRRLTEDGNREAREFFRRAIFIDPNYARAHANLALTYGQGVVFRLGEDLSSHDLALKEALRAVELDPNLPQAQFALAVVHLSARSHDHAIEAARRAVHLDPNYADGYAVLAQTLAYGGDLDEALSAIRTAKELSPRYTFSYLWVEAHILFQQRRYEDARAILEDVVDRNPAFLVGRLTLAATYGHLGQREDADWLRNEILTLSPNVSALTEGRIAPYRLETDRTHLVEGLIDAGIPK